MPSLAQEFPMPHDSDTAAPPLAAAPVGSSAGPAVAIPPPAFRGLGPVRLALPADHPQRMELNEEVHARPAEAMSAPMRVSYLALATDAAEAEGVLAAVADLAQRRGVPGPVARANHFSTDLGPFRLRWERHTEFSRIMVMVPGAGEDPFAEPALSALPAEWVAALPGRLVMAAHAALVRHPAEETPDHEAISARFFGGNVLVGSGIAGGAAVALTDVRIRPDGFTRFLILDRAMSPWQAGRQVQRLLEIDTYRMMALMALPVARALSPFIAERERELAGITAALVNAKGTDEAVLLEQLTRLAAGIENREAENLYRFAASAAYYELVQRRIAELREVRIEGLQTLLEFNERRVAPAMNTCRAVEQRLEALSARVAQTTQLLSTRVEITREGQTQAVLEQMNRRAKLQLRLQQTVEGLSVAAITYYIVGLVYYAGRALEGAGLGISAEELAGISIPVVAGIIALGVRSIRRAVHRAVG
jgi:uncharacterized membrane-anchored protein